MPLAPLNVVIVGAGAIGQVHARIAAARPELRLTALVNRTVQKADELAGVVETELRAARPAVFSTLEAALDSADIDLVVIATPSGSHVVDAERAIAAGTHVVIEKPIDVELVGARRILQLSDEARASGQLVTVISQRRFTPAIVAVKNAIDEGRFGRVTSATATVAWWRSQQYYDSGNWRGTWQLDGGGALMNQGVHTVDQLLHLLGTPHEVFGQTALLSHDGIEVEDTAAAVIRFESGALATILATTAAFTADATRIQVHGSRGSAFIHDNKLEYFHADDGHGAFGNQAAREVGSDGMPGGPDEQDLAAGLMRQYDDIIDALSTGREPGVTVGHATAALALIRSVYLSQTLGKPVLFADVLGGVYDDVTPVTGPRP